MNDQASSLRLLKKRLDGSDNGGALTREAFLATIPRPSRFVTILLVPLSQKIRPVPPMQQWLPGFLDREKRSCVWDQAGLFSAGTLFLDSEESGLPVIQHIETINGPLLAFPSVSQFPGIIRAPDPGKIRFLKHVDHLIGSARELWITLPHHLIPISQSLVHAVDLIFVITPDTPEFILQAYETIKGLHLSGFFAPLGLIVDQGENETTAGSIFHRINSVANQFLSLDLHLGGMITSHNTTQEKVKPISVRTLIDGVSPGSRDFSYLLAERLFFPSPGDGME
jgi:hypothetical protein